MLWMSWCWWFWLICCFNVCDFSFRWGLFFAFFIIWFSYWSIILFIIDFNFNSLMLSLPNWRWSISFSLNDRSIFFFLSFFRFGFSFDCTLRSCSHSSCYRFCGMFWFCRFLSWFIWFLQFFCLLNYCCRSKNSWLEWLFLGWFAIFLFKDNILWWNQCCLWSNFCNRFIFAKVMLRNTSWSRRLTYKLWSAILSWFLNTFNSGFTIAKSKKFWV